MLRRAHTEDALDLLRRERAGAERRAAQQRERQVGAVGDAPGDLGSLGGRGQHGSGPAPRPAAARAPWMASRT